MQALIVAPASLLDIPLGLIEQKRTYNVDALLSIARHPSVSAFTFADDQGLIGFVIFIFDPMYGSLCIDTLVIDRARRSIPMLHRVAEHVVALAKAMAGNLGAKRIMCGMRGAKFMRRWFPEAKPLYTAIGMDLEPKETLNA